MQITKRIIENNLKYENTVILKYHIEYPEITNENNTAIRMFNIYNERIAKDLQKRAESELYIEAIELYKYNKQNNYPIMIYEIYRTYEVTLNTNKLISLYADEYIFTGGAHGNTIRTSQTWNMDNARMIRLYELYRNPYFILNILKQIITQINNEKDIYFEDACCLVIETFNPQNFYLTPSSVVIYFQQYDIAPYSSGIRTFKLNK